MSGRERNPDIFLSMPHPCSYLPGRTAATLFIDPRFALDRNRYGAFTRLGFRRSGDLIYRPHCPGCAACVPVRIPVERFVPSRGQRRIWRKNRDVHIVTRPGVFMHEHFDLYLRYQAWRHPGGGMDDPDSQKYINFLTGRRVETSFHEMREVDRLLGVAVVDRLNDGLSAVYTFYEPDAAARGLGTFAILWEIERARSLRLPWVYLGYWIADSRKMAYKTNFRPTEVYRNGQWAELETPAAKAAISPVPTRQSAAPVKIHPRQ